MMTYSLPGLRLFFAPFPHGVRQNTPGVAKLLACKYTLRQVQAQRVYSNTFLRRCGPRGSSEFGSGKAVLDAGNPSHRQVLSLESLSKFQNCRLHPRLSGPSLNQASRARCLHHKTTPERENITNIPNVLTVTRLAAAPVIGYLILHDYHSWAVALIAYASLTDLIDGYLARRWNLQTVIGSVLDPLADKSLMTVLTVCLGIKGLLPVWLVATILGKDVGLGIAAIYYRWVSLPPPKTFWRYWDFSLPSAEVTPTTISKVNTALQLGLLLSISAAPISPVDLSKAIYLGQYVVGITTVWSGLSYIYTKNAVRILPRGDRTPPTLPK